MTKSYKDNVSRTEEEVVSFYKPAWEVMQSISTTFWSSRTRLVSKEQEVDFTSWFLVVEGEKRF